MGWKEVLDPFEKDHHLGILIFFLFALVGGCVLLTAYGNGLTFPATGGQIAAWGVAAGLYLLGGYALARQVVDVERQKAQKVLEAFQKAADEAVKVAKEEAREEIRVVRGLLEEDRRKYAKEIEKCLQETTFKYQEAAKKYRAHLSEQAAVTEERLIQSVETFQQQAQTGVQNFAALYSGNVAGLHQVVADLQKNVAAIKVRD